MEMPDLELKTERSQMENKRILENDILENSDYVSPEKLEREIRSIEDEVENLLEFEQSYVKSLLKFGLASWLFGLSMFVASLIVIYGPNLVINAPPVSISILGGAVAAPFIITEAFLRRYRHRIKKLKEERKYLKSRYERAVLFERQRKAEERKELLYTMLRQDLRSKCQLTSGYLQMLKEADIPEEYASYLDKALESSNNELEIIEKINILRDVENGSNGGVVNLDERIKKALEEIRPQVVEKDVEVKTEYHTYKSKVRGGYHVDNLISNLLEARLYDSDCNEIKIFTREKNNERILLRIEDDGSRMRNKVKEQISQESYNGETTGIGGLSIYISRKIAEQIDCEIELKESQNGGTCFDVHFSKA